MACRADTPCRRGWYVGPGRLPCRRMVRNRAWHAGRRVGTDRRIATDIDGIRGAAGGGVGAQTAVDRFVARPVRRRAGRGKQDQPDRVVLAKYCLVDPGAVVDHDRHAVSKALLSAFRLAHWYRHPVRRVDVCRPALCDCA